MTTTQSVQGEPTPGDRGLAALEAIDVTKRFGSTTALDGVHLRVDQGVAHALVGRNGAGKSTLVSIVTGLEAPDEGSIAFSGRPAPALHDRDRWRELVACVYQKSTVISSLSVAENLFLNRQHTVGPVISWKTLRRQAQRLVDEWDIGIDVSRPADSLTVEQRQMVEIARALSFGARFIIFDEPTAQLDPRGIARLFERLRQLHDRGVSYLYISHHLEEIYEVCQEVTVFRDARHILTAPVAEIGTPELVDAMTGEAPLLEVSDQAPSIRPGRPILEVDHISVSDAVDDVSVTLRPGEVVGITGSGSSGRVTLGETIVGLRRPTSGRIVVDGHTPRPGSVPSALRAGVGFVPRDRHHEGLVETLSVAENLTMTVQGRLGRWGYVSPRRRDEISRHSIRQLSVVASSPAQPAGSLSGGNQQKLVMGRALASQPRLLVLLHPTAGVDVRSKATLISVIDDVRRQGTAVLIVSDELDDLRPCDRVLVMQHGRITAELPRGWQDSDVVAATEGIGPEHD